MFSECRLCDLVVNQLTLVTQNILNIKFVEISSYSIYASLTWLGSCHLLNFEANGVVQNLMSCQIDCSLYRVTMILHFA